MNELDLSGVPFLEARDIIFETPRLPDGTLAASLDYYWSDDAACLAFWSRLLSTIPEWAQRYDHASVDKVLFSVTFLGNGHLADAVIRGNAAIELRREAASQIRALFSDLYERYCSSDVLSMWVDCPHDPLDGSCYMFWDNLGAFAHPADEQIDHTLFRTVCDLLSSANVTCQLSALHGLGHVASYRTVKWRAPARDAIAGWLASHDAGARLSTIPEGLRQRLRGSAFLFEDAPVPRDAGAAKRWGTRSVPAELVFYARAAYHGAVL